MNYNISIDIENIPGARVMEVQGKSGPRRCVVIPIDNDKGTLIDAYRVFDHRIGGVTVRPLKTTRLNLAALENRDIRFGSHYLKPSFERDYYKAMTAEQRAAVPFVGKMQEMGAKSEAAGRRGDDGDGW